MLVHSRIVGSPLAYTTLSGRTLRVDAQSIDTLSACPQIVLSVLERLNRACSQASPVPKEETVIAWSV